MYLGLTYDLRDDYLAAGYDAEQTVEFDSEETVAAIEGALSALGHRCCRIGHVRELASRLVAGERWPLVFNIAEGFQGVAREAQVPALLDAYGVAYTFSDAVVCGITLHKAFAKRVVRDCGVPTAPFAVVSCLDDALAVDLPYPLFVKPLAEGSSKGIAGNSILGGRDDLLERCRDLLARLEQPLLVETYLPGREFTVGIVGTGARSRALGVLEVGLRENAEPGVYSFANKEEYEDRVLYSLADDAVAREAAELALAAWRGLGCRDGGRIDLRADESGRPHFLEANPLPGLNPRRSDLPILCRLLGIAYGDLIERIVASALERVPAGCGSDESGAERSGAAHCACSH